MNDITPPKKKRVASAKVDAAGTPRAGTAKPSVRVQAAANKATPTVKTTKTAREAPAKTLKKTATSTAVKSAPLTARKKKKEKDEMPDVPESMDIANLTVEQTALEVPKPGRWKKIVGGTITIVVLLAVAIVAAAFFWYQDQLKPVDEANTGDVKVAIVQGMGPEEIGALLKKNNLIKSELGFEWYLRITRSANNLQAGTYALSQSMSMPDIVSQLKGGKTETLRITFLPGATVSANKEVLKKAGFQESKIDAAFSKQYDHPVLKGKPASADLEGYIYGETYEFNADATVEEILDRTFDELQKVIKINNLESAFQKRGLSLYKGITLASIVQREVPDGRDQRMVAQVFYNRLKEGMNLGSDVTYQYIADKEGKPRDTNYDSPYNTRRYPGLPPGPIASPGNEALLAVAQPAKHDYLYFLSGDDDVTYFGRTEADHQRNIDQHCQKKCQIL